MHQEKNLTIVVFARNEHFSTIQTLEAIQELQRENSTSIKIVYVDDRSSEENFKIITSHFHGRISPKFKILKKPTTLQKGIRDSILFGMDQQISDYIMPLPGHNMFDLVDVRKVVDNLHDVDVVIGVRSNLYRSRAFGKFLSSRIFFLVTTFFLPLREFKDLHGLNIYPSALLKTTLPFCSSHENHLLPLVYIKKNEIKFRTVSICVRENHKSESRNAGRPGWPKLSDITDSFLDLQKALKYFKTSKI